MVSLEMLRAEKAARQSEVRPTPAPVDEEVKQQIKAVLAEKRDQIETIAKAKEQVVARKMASVYEDLRLALAVMKEHGIAEGKRDRKAVAELSALEKINRTEAE